MSARGPRSIGALTLALFAHTSCYRASFDDCAIDCSTAKSCPDGLSCGADGLCRTSAAECSVLIDAPADGIPPSDASVEERVGHPDDFGRTSSPWSANEFRGFRVFVSSPRELVRFGVIGKQAGRMIKMALYSESGGVPTTLVAATEAFALPDGPREVAVPPVRLPVGNYWLGAVTDLLGYFGQSSTGSMTFCSRPQPFASALPTDFGAVNMYSVQFVWNYWIVVR